MEQSSRTTAAHVAQRRSTPMPEHNDDGYDIAQLGHDTKRRGSSRSRPDQEAEGKEETRWSSRLTRTRRDGPCCLVIQPTVRRSPTNPKSPSRPGDSEIELPAMPARSAVVTRIKIGVGASSAIAEGDTARPAGRQRRLIDVRLTVRRVVRGSRRFPPSRGSDLFS